MIRRSSHLPPHGGTGFDRGPLFSGLSALLLVLGVHTGTATAQTMDYGATEKLFGEPVTLSATGQPQSVSETPVDMTIVTQDDIRRSGAVDIAGAIRFVTGIDERQYGALHAEIGLRGYNQPFNPRLLVLLDGREVYLNDYGEVDWSSIPAQLAEIRQIEIIKGPNSAIYGFNAAYGVINIVTYDPLLDPINVGQILGGEDGTAGASAVTSFRLGAQTGVRLSAGGLQTRNFSGAGAYMPDLPVVSPRVGTMAANAKTQLTPDIQLSGGISATDSRGAFNEGYSTSDVFIRTNSVRLGVNAATRFGLLGFSAYRNEERYSDLPDYGSLHGQAYDVQANDDILLGTEHSLRASLEYRNDSLQQPLGTVGYSSAAFGATWSWRLASDLMWTNSLRLDHVELRYSGGFGDGAAITAADYDHRTLDAVSFNSGLAYDINDSDTARLFAGRGYQIPSLYDLGFQGNFADPSGAYSLIGNPRLQPTAVVNVGLNYLHRLPAVNSTLNLSVFAQRSDSLYLEPSSTAGTALADGSTAYSAQNTGYGLAAGGEIEFKGSLRDGPRWRLAYSFATTADHTGTNEGAQPTSYEDFGKSTPHHVVTLALGDTFGRWELDGEARWQSGYRDYLAPDQITLEEYRIGSYVTATMRAGYRVSDQATIALAINQLNAPKLQEVAGPRIERRGIVSLTVRY